MSLKRLIAGVVVLALDATITAAATIAGAFDQASPVIIGSRAAPLLFLDGGENVIDHDTPGNYVYYLDGVLGFGTVAPIDTVFTANASQGTTEYVIDQTFQNLTGTPWIGFRIELGFGTGGSFVSSVAADGLNFAQPNLPVLFYSDNWSVASLNSDLLIWGTLGLSDSTFLEGFTVLEAAIDIPDIGESNYTFTLRQTPIVVQVPEPSTGGMTVLGLMGLLRTRRLGSLLVL